MTDAAASAGRFPLRRDEEAHRLRRRRMAAERRFRRLGIVAIAAALAFLAIFLGSIVVRGYMGFVQTEILVPVSFSPGAVDPEGTGADASLAAGNYRAVLRDGLATLFPGDADTRAGRRALAALVSAGAPFTLRDMVRADPSLVGRETEVWLLASDPVDQFRKGRISADLPEGDRPVDDAALARIAALEAEGRLAIRFNDGFFSRGDSRNPEEAGILGAIVGSALAMVVTLAVSFPLGVMTAVYLESFAPRNRVTRIIELNINNLAAVPSIVFGLLGLAVFLNFFGMPRSAPVSGGLVLSLMTLPTIIISSRAAIRAVPPSIAEAAVGLGASKVQAMLHHVLPLAAPGMLTGTIIGLAQALGETAPLLMMGMVAFIVEVPQGFTDPSTVLPAQIYLWADSPERGFAEKTAAAIMVLLGFLILMNALAVYLRRRFENRW